LPTQSLIAPETIFDRICRLGDTLDQADKERARAKHRDQEHREQAVNNLRGGIHEQGYQPESDDSARDGSNSRQRRAIGGLIGRHAHLWPSLARKLDGEYS
jgi:hypothetical protein